MLNLYLMRLIPEKYRLVLVLSLFLFLLAAVGGIGFGSGWKVNGYRLTAKIEKIDSDLSACSIQKQILTDSITVQNDEISRWQAEAAKKQADTSLALAKARNEAQEANKRIADLRATSAKTCEEGMMLIDKALGL